jgi:hypothetical protein
MIGVVYRTIVHRHSGSLKEPLFLALVEPFGCKYAMLQQEITAGKGRDVRQAG